MAYTISHEFTHFIEDWSGEKFRIFANALFEELGKSKVDVDAMVEAKLEQARGRKEYKGKTEEQLYDIAYSEVVAECCETMLTDTNALKKLSTNLKAKDQTLWNKIAEFFRGLADRLKKAYKDANLSPDSEIANQAKDTIRNVEKLRDLWAEAGADAITSYNAAAERDTGAKKAAGDGGVKYQARSNGPFDDAEISAIQSIGRKSINSFTSSDIQKTEAFAKRYWQEMGTKSPFFRAWFGDWRVNDQTPVQIADRPGSTRGIQHNDDTGWDIQVSGQVFNETKSHKSTVSREAVPYLPYINDIVKKSVLLDSVGVGKGKTKSGNSLLMHSLYAVSDIGNGPEVLRLYVEEMNDPNSGDTKKRAYQLHNIEKAFAASVRVQGNAPSSLTNTANAIRTVSDLFAAVKNMDANFIPNAESKVVNADGTPMIVYHQTANEFTIFDPRHEGAGTRDSDTPFGIFLKSSDKDIGLKGGKQMALYASIKNPLVVQNRQELTQKLSKLSQDYKQAYEDLRKLNADYQQKFDDAKEAWRNYMVEWRKEHPDASRTALYDDEQFNKLFRMT